MASRSVVPCLAAALAGLLVGGMAASQYAPRLNAVEAPAVGSGASALMAGPVGIRPVRIDRSTTIPVEQDAVYFLDYKGARLMAAVPNVLQTVGGQQVLSDFAVRDLIADFRPPRGTTPRFLMTVGRLGDDTGWAPLIVVEAETRQVATYRVQPQGASVSGNRAPAFDLVELRRLP